MFNKGDYIVYGMSGVCLVDDITNSPFGSVEEKTYYVLKPVTSVSGASVFTPIDNSTVNMRPIMSENDIHALRESIPGIEVIGVEFEKKRRDVYRSVLATNIPSEWLRIIRTVAERRHAFKLAHKRLPEVDGEFESAAKRFLFNEMAIVLGTTCSEIEALVTKRLCELFPDMADVISE